MKVKNIEKQIEMLEKLRVDLLSGKGEAFIDSLKHQKLNQQKKLLESEIKLLNKKIENSPSEVQQIIGQLQSRRNSTSPSIPYLNEQFIRDSLNAVQLPITLRDSLKLIQTAISGIENEIKENTFGEKKIKQANNNLKVAKQELKIAEEKYNQNKNGWEFDLIRDKYEEDIKKNLDEFNKIRARDIHLKWLGIGGNISNQSYKMFDPAREINNQIFDEKDLIPTLIISYSNYKNQLNEESTFSARNISFFTVAGELKYGNNIEKLSGLTIETTDSLAPNRISVKSQKAYVGEFEDNIVTGVISSDYYRFIGAKNNLGYHLRAELDILDNFFILTSIRGGVVFAITSQDDLKSILNFELFMGINDIFKAGGEDTIFGRNVFGIQTTIPFNFNN